MLLRPLLPHRSPWVCVPRISSHAQGTGLRKCLVIGVVFAPPCTHRLAPSACLFPKGRADLTCGAVLPSCVRWAWADEPVKTHPVCYDCRSAQSSFRLGAFCGHSNGHCDAVPDVAAELAEADSHLLRGAGVSARSACPPANLGCTCTLIGVSGTHGLLRPR